MKIGELNLLAQAVGMADSWRGSMVGNPDTSELDRHDRFIERCREIIAAERAKIKEEAAKLAWAETR